MDVYTKEYDSLYPVVCMDESPKQLVGEVKQALPTMPGQVRKVDVEYERKGIAEIFGAIEPLTGRLFVRVTETRTKKDWAKFISQLVDIEYKHAKKIILVMDNLNTHTLGSLYETFPPEEAKRLSDKLELHYTPKHASWLNIAEIGFSMLKRQCIPERVDNIDELRKRIDAWVEERNNVDHKVNWQFRTDDARIKLRKLYPEYS